MRPRADEVMKSIIWTFDEHILPNVQGAFPKSLALSVSNQLRHVLLRMEREAPAMIEDNAELRSLLQEIGTYIASLPAPHDSLRVLQRDLTNAGTPAQTSGYVSLLALTEEATDLRTLLDTVLKALQQQRSSLGTSKHYQAIRNRIRDYLQHQLERQSLWIREAFTIARR